MMSFIQAEIFAGNGALAASIVVKATIAIVFGLIGAWLARRNRAAVRHALLAAAFGVLLALPIASLVLPSVRIAAPASLREAGPILAGATGAISGVQPARESVAVVSAAPWAALSPSAWLLSAWIAGMALFLLPVLAGLWQVRSLRRSALPWPHGQSVLDELARRAGIHRRVELLLHEALPGPMTCGATRPAIVLPPDAQTWDGGDLNRAMVHELEHVRRGDWMSHCVARAICAAYWFHPLVWIAWRQLALEAERSCDDAVLGGSEATAYADQLVGLARRLSLAGKSPLPAMANRTDLATRVGAVLDTRQRRGRAGRFAVALACAGAAALVLTISPLTMVASPQLVSTAQNDSPVGRLAVDDALVIEAVTVSDSNGKTIEGLAASDFAITEDGVPQSIQVFEFQKLAQLQNGISSYYILGYYTMNQNMDGSYRRIKITCKDPMAKLDYRAGYYGDKRFGVAPAGGKAPGGKGNAGPVPGVAYPQLTRKVEPEYSEEARKAKFQGVVVVSVEVDASGQVTNPSVVRSLGLGLDEKAIQAVQQWRFKPGTKDGTPATMRVEVEVSFRLL